MAERRQRRRFFRGVHSLYCRAKPKERNGAMEHLVERAVFCCMIRILATSVLTASFLLLGQAQGKERPVEYPTAYRTVQIDGLSIFYREAGRTTR